MSLSDRAPPAMSSLQGLGSVTSTMKESEEWGGGDRGGEVRGRGEKKEEEEGGEKEEEEEKEEKEEALLFLDPFCFPLTELFCSDEKKTRLRTSLSLQLTATQRSTLGTGRRGSSEEACQLRKKPSSGCCGVPEKGIPRSSPDPPRHSPVCV